MQGLTSARLAGAIFGAALVFGCTPGQRLALDGGLARAQGAKDAEAKVLRTSICAMSIGAYHRLDSDLERRALDVLCGGIDGALASADELNARRGAAKSPGGL